MGNTKYALVPIRQILGDPIIRKIDPARDGFGSDNYPEDSISDLAKSYSLDLDGVDAFSAEYLNWVEVLVLRDRKTGSDVAAMITMGRGCWDASTLESLEIEIVEALFQEACVDFNM